MLGTADKVTINKEHTTIVNGGGDKEAIATRIVQIRKQIEASTSDYDKEKLAGASGQTRRRCSVLYVGAATEVEMKEKKDRVEVCPSRYPCSRRRGYHPGRRCSLHPRYRSAGEPQGRE